MIGVCSIRMFMNTLPPKCFMDGWILICAIVKISLLIYFANQPVKCTGMLQRSTMWSYGTAER